MGYFLAFNLTGSSYLWSPSVSLSNGNYSLELFPSEIDGPYVYSDPMILSGGQTEGYVSSFSNAPSPSTTSAPSTIKSTSSSSPTTPTVTLVTGYAVPTSISNPTPPDIQPDPAPQHTVSHGATGIVIGAVTFLILTSASAILYRRRRRRFSKSAVLELPNNQTDADIKSDPNTTIWVPELDQEGAVYGPHELPGTPTPLEEPLETTEAGPAEGRVVEIGDPE